MNKILNELENLYSQVHKCDKCFKLQNGNIRYDKMKVERKVFKHIINSKIFIIAQALAEKQVRLSGIPFHEVSGEMSEGGRQLEKYLNKIGYTLSPKRNDLIYVYSTDVVQCFPGKKKSGTGDNAPTSQEINNCRNWLIKECKLMKPKVVLLFGRPAAKMFLNYFLSEEVISLSDYFLKKKRLKINNENISVYVLPHPTSMVKGKGQIFEKTFSFIAKEIK